MKKMFLLMKNMMRLFFKNKALVTQLSILMIVSTVVIVATTITVQRLQKSQSDIKKIGLQSDFLVDTKEQDNISFNEIEVSDNLVKHNEKLTQLTIFNQNILKNSNNYLQLIDPTFNNHNLYWPTNKNNRQVEVLNLEGNIDWNKINQLKLQTVFWFETRQESNQNFANNYEDLVYEYRNFKNQLVGFQNLSGGRILFQSPTLKQTNNNYDSTFKVNAAIVQKNTPFKTFFDFNKHEELGFKNKSYFTNPVLIRNIDLNSKQVIQTINDRSNQAIDFKNYQNTFQAIVDTLEANTIKKDFYSVNLHVDFSTLSTKYLLFANYLNSEGIDKNRYADELKIDNYKQKYLDLFQNQVLIPKELINDPKKFDEVQKIITKAKVLLLTKIREETNIFYENSQKLAEENRYQIKDYEAQLKQINIALQNSNYSNFELIQLKNQQKVLAANLDQAKFKRFLYNDLIAQDFHSVLNNYDVFYRKHESAIHNDVKSDSNFIVTNVSNPTYAQNGVIAPKNEWIDNMVQIDEKNKKSQNPNKKFKRIFIDNHNSNKINDFYNLYSNYIKAIRTLEKSYEKDPNTDKDLLVEQRDYSPWVNTSFINIYQLPQFFNVLFNESEWLLSIQYLREMNEYKKYLYQIFEPYKDKNWIFNLNHQNWKDDQQVIAIYKNANNPKDQKQYYFNGYIKNHQAYIDVKYDKNLPTRLQLVNIVKKDEENQKNTLINVLERDLNDYTNIINFKKGIKDINTNQQAIYDQWALDNPQDYAQFKIWMSKIIKRYNFLQLQQSPYGYTIQAQNVLTNVLLLPFTINIINRSSDLAYVSTSYIKANQKTAKNTNSYKEVGNYEDFLEALKLPYRVINDEPNYREITLADGSKKRIAKDYYSWINYVVSPANKVEINGQFFFIIGAVDSPEFLFPAINDSDILINKQKSTVLYVNDSGFAKLKTIAASVPILEYYTLKVNTNNFNLLQKNNVYNQIKSELLSAKKGNIYKKTDKDNPYRIYVKRTLFLTQLRNLVIAIAVGLIVLILLLGIYFVASSIKNMINKNKVMFGAMQAQGVTRWQAWLSFAPFYTIPSLIVLIIGYSVAYAIQPLIMRLFSSYWLIPIPEQFVSVGWIFAIPITLALILGFICWTLIFYILKQPTAETMKGDAGFKINKFIIGTKAIFLKFGAIRVLKATYVVANLARMLILLVIASSFSIIASIIATTKNNFSQSASITNAKREYEYAVDLYSPTEQGGFYYISKFEEMGVPNEYSPLKQIVQNVKIEVKIKNLINKKVNVVYINNQTKQKVIIEAIINEKGLINFKTDQLINGSFMFEGIYEQETNRLLIGSQNLSPYLININNQKIGHFSWSDHKQYIHLLKSHFSDNDVILDYVDSNNQHTYLKPKIQDQTLVFDLSLLNQKQKYRLVNVINTKGNPLVDLSKINDVLKTLDYSKNGRYLYGYYGRLPYLYFNNLPQELINQKVYLTYTINQTNEIRICGVVNEQKEVVFDLTKLKINPQQSYQLRDMRIEKTNLLVYDSKQHEFNDNLIYFDNNYYGLNNHDKNQISIDYLSVNRNLYLTLKAMRNEFNNKNKVPFITTKAIAQLVEPNVGILDYNQLEKGYIYQISSATLEGSDTNLYLDNVNAIDKTKDSGLPYSSLKYNNAMREIKDLGTDHPVYGKMLSNVYYPSISTQPEILQNIRFFDSKVISKSSLDGNISVKATDVNIEFNPWVFAKTFLPITAIARSELNEKHLLDEAFKNFGYEIIDGKKVNKLYDVPNFEDDGIVRQVSLWTKTGLPPKSENDEDAFFVKINGQWKINEKPGVLTEQGAAEFLPEFLRLITQMYTFKSTRYLQYKAGLKFVNIEDEKTQQPYTYLLGQMQTKTKKFGNEIKILGINYEKNKFIDDKPSPTTQLSLINDQGVNLIDLIKDDNVNNEVHNIIINKVVAQKYHLNINDVFEYEINNHIKRLSNKFNNTPQVYKTKFKVVGINDSLMDEQLIINQKIANKLIGFDDYRERMQVENGHPIIEAREFNGFFTKEKSPIFFNNMASFYSPSGLSPAIDSWPQNLLENIGGNVQNINIYWIFYYSWDLANSILNASFDKNKISWDSFSEVNLDKLLKKMSKIFGKEANLPSFKAVDANIENEIFASVIDKTSFTLLLNIIIAIIPSLVIIIILVASTLANESRRLIAIMKVLGMRDFKNVNNFMFIYPIVWLLNILIATPLSFGIIHIYKLAIFAAFNIVLVASIPWWIFVVSFGFVGLVLLFAWLQMLYKTKKLNLPKALNQFTD
ncbi:ABC transporter permease [Ureaplasma urealyticum]|uniref:ABC transporter permease n=1 Tax=Ureaplasma urealyticum TaxID=2130 RepID=A0AAP9AC96_UREUR|nr:ABC transporter permease [Ureaplasma urealyticum]QDI65131.1 ABC transporter permease [Ureaplasma urealyticum]